MSAPLVTSDTHGDVTIITLNDPATLNAASLPMAEQLLLALQKAEAASRAIVLTGAGRGFCSGANLAAGDGIASPDADLGAALESHFNPLLRAIRALRVPFVTAVNGPAAGIGCSFALAGDFVVAAETSYFLQAFRHIGLVPDGGSAFLLTRGAGRVRAMEMMLFGERIPAARALDWGLINRVVPPEALEEQALSFAARLAAGPTGALTMIRKMCWDSLESGFEAQLDSERILQGMAGRTAEHREGVAAFREKRAADFSRLTSAEADTSLRSASS